MTSPPCLAPFNHGQPGSTQGRGGVRGVHSHPMLDWIQRKLLKPTPAEAAMVRAIEAAQALLARGKPHAALGHLTGDPPDNDYLLASYVDVKVRAALGLRDLLALEAMGPYAQALARLLPDKAALLMREAEAVGALGLAAALGEALAENGKAVAEDLLRIKERRSGPSAGEALLGLARDALGEDYQDLRLAGIGPSSFVVTAVPTNGQDRVAVKFLGPGAYMDERSRARFEREANLLEQLDNPHILKIFSYHALDPPYMVTEFFPGYSLRQLLEQGRIFDAEATCRIGLKLCSALQAAHAAGIIHRDVEPGNILVSPSAVKLIDFGLARTGQWEVSAQGSLLGDWAYMPPEQYAATLEKPSVQLDVFGLGAVLHHMLTGEPPYRRSNMIIRERNRALQEMREELPDSLVQLVLMALAENPDVRPRTIADLAEGLRQVYLRKDEE